MGTCGKITASGKKCQKPVVNGHCGAKHSPVAGRIVSVGRFSGRVAGRTVGAKTSGAVGAATFGVGKAGFSAVSKVDPTEIENAIRDGVEDGKNLGERTIPQHHVI